jgi:dnd system-associated protein 4
MRKVPDRLYVRKEDLRDFKLLQEEKDSPFYKKDNKSVFIMAMTMGLKRGVQVPLQNKEGFIREEYLNDVERSLIKAVAISTENDLSVLANMQRVYQIAEEYAAGGIKYLKDSVLTERYGTYLKRLESELLDDFKSLELED